MRVEQVPWADGKHQWTATYVWFLARWAKRLSGREVAVAFHTTWDHVFRAVAMAVAWGRAHADLTGVEAIGIDEIALVCAVSSGTSSRPCGHAVAGSL